MTGTTCPWPHTEALEQGCGWQVDQAALTGESLPVKKFPGHIAFSGSTIKQGEQVRGALARLSPTCYAGCPPCSTLTWSKQHASCAAPCTSAWRHALKAVRGWQEALVYATGSNTFFGRAAALIAGTNAVANIQKVSPAWACFIWPLSLCSSALQHASCSIAGLLHYLCSTSHVPHPAGDGPLAGPASQLLRVHTGQHAGPACRVCSLCCAGHDPHWSRVLGDHRHLGGH